MSTTANTQLLQYMHTHVHRHTAHSLCSTKDHTKMTLVSPYTILDEPNATSPKQKATIQIQMDNREVDVIWQCLKMS